MPSLLAKVNKILFFYESRDITPEQNTWSTPGLPFKAPDFQIIC